MQTTWSDFSAHCIPPAQVMYIDMVTRLAPKCKSLLVNFGKIQNFLSTSGKKHGILSGKLL